MRFTTCLGLATLTCSLLACGDETTAEECPTVENPVIESFDVTPTTLAAGDTIDATVAGQELGFEEGHHAEEGGHSAEEESTCKGGHLHVYLDELMTNPLVMTEETTFQITIPADTAAGDHTLIARLQNRDHSIYEPEVTKEVTITVQ